MLGTYLTSQREIDMWDELRARQPLIGASELLRVLIRRGVPQLLALPPMELERILLTEGKATSPTYPTFAPSKVGMSKKNIR